MRQVVSFHDGEVDSVICEEPEGQFLLPACQEIVKSRGKEVHPDGLDPFRDDKMCGELSHLTTCLAST